MDMKPISEKCSVCEESFDGFDDGSTLEHWPDGVFLTPTGPWVCQDCLPDGFKMGIRQDPHEVVLTLKACRGKVSHD